MRRLLAICSAVGLLGFAVGCQNCCHIAGKCDCCDRPEYGCHYDMYYPCHVTSPAPAVPAAEPIKPLPKEVLPKEE